MLSVYLLWRLFAVLHLVFLCLCRVKERRRRWWPGSLFLAVKSTWWRSEQSSRGSTKDPCTRPSLWVPVCVCVCDRQTYCNLPHKTWPLNIPERGSVQSQWKIITQKHVFLFHFINELKQIKTFLEVLYCCNQESNISSRWWVKGGSLSSSFIITENNTHNCSRHHVPCEVS